VKIVSEGFRLERFIRRSYIFMGLLLATMLGCASLDSTSQPRFTPEPARESLTAVITPQPQGSPSVPLRQVGNQTEDNPSDNGPEFTAKAIREWLAGVGARTLYIEPGSPWENGYVESFNGKLRDELLDREIFYTLREVQILTEQYRHTYNRVRPHSSLGYRPPAPQAVLTAEPIPELVGLT